MLPDLTEIQRRRRIVGVTQTELGKATSLSRSLIAKTETGRLIPSYAKAKLIFDTLEALEKESKSSLLGVTLGKICSRQIEYVGDCETIGQVWKRMKETGFSQFPVRRGKVIVGNISEKAINSAVLAGDPTANRDTLVTAIMEDQFPVLAANTPVASTIDLLQHCQALLVQEDGLLIGITTNADIGKVFELRSR